MGKHAILDWKGDYRFVGLVNSPYRGRELHICRFEAEVQRWFASNGNTTVRTLCGTLAHPQFFSTLLVPPDDLCPECDRLHQEGKRGDA